MQRSITPPIGVVLATSKIVSYIETTHVMRVIGPVKMSEGHSSSHFHQPRPLTSIPYTYYLYYKASRVVSFFIV